MFFYHYISKNKIGTRIRGFDPSENSVNSNIISTELVTHYQYKTRYYNYIVTCIFYPIAFNEN